MPIYEYACHNCKKFVEIIVRRTEGFTPRCPECESKKLTRMISRFQFHLSELSKIEQLDPKYDKMIDAASPDLSFENMVKQYRLDQPMTTKESRKKLNEGKGPGLIPGA
jgi:putative FmdB family regulatory protein